MTKVRCFGGGGCGTKCRDARLSMLNCETYVCKACNETNVDGDIQNMLATVAKTLTSCDNVPNFVVKNSDCHSIATFRLSLSTAIGLNVTPSYK